jgi:hypothetical protein
MKQGYIFGALLMAFGVTADASTIYSYKGANFEFFVGDSESIPGGYDAGMSISLSFELASPIPANAVMTDFSNSLVTFFISDGRSVRTSLGPDDAFDVLVSTDASGLPSTWQVLGSFWDGTPLADGSVLRTLHMSKLGGPSVDEVKISLCGAGCPINGSIVASELAQSFSDGTWTVTPSAVPIPSAVFLLSSALGAIGLARKYTS